jgi:hypothetical protein
MALNVEFLVWCEEERQRAMDETALMDKQLAALVSDGSTEEERASLLASIERHLRYFDTLGEAMLAHRDVRGGTDA